MERTIRVKKTTLRRELENSAVSTNSPLREKVKIMDNIELLRNVHPLYRSDFAYKLLKEKAITTDEAKEFTKVIGR